jgi:hypothetical protein
VAQFIHGLLNGEQKRYTENHQPQEDQPQAIAQRLSLGTRLATPHNVWPAAGAPHFPACGPTIATFNHWANRTLAARHHFGVFQNLRNDGFEIPFGHDRLLLEQKQALAKVSALTSVLSSGKC